MKRSIAVFAILIFFAAFFFRSSEAQAVYISAYATGGAQLAFNDHEIADGYLGDYTAEATHNSTVSGDNDQGYAKASLTETGVELKSKSYAPDKYANSTARIVDWFTVDTMTGSQGQTLEALLSFDLTGTMQVSNTLDADGSLYVDLYARHEWQPYLDSIFIRYEVAWDTNSNKQVGFNDNANWDNLFQVNPTVTGNTYNFNIPLGLDLQGIIADEPVELTMSISTSGSLATVDFSNTLKTNQENPFVITSAPPGSSYMLVTSSNHIDYGVGLFGSLDGQEVGPPVPIPGAVWLLGSGLAGIAALRRKLKK
jgi:hypothetical protein